MVYLLKTYLSFDYKLVRLVKWPYSTSGGLLAAQSIYCLAVFGILPHHKEAGSNMEIRIMT